MRTRISRRSGALACCAALALAASPAGAVIFTATGQGDLDLGAGGLDYDASGSPVSEAAVDADGAVNSQAFSDVVDGAIDTQAGAFAIGGDTFASASAGFTQQFTNNTGSTSFFDYSILLEGGGVGRFVPSAGCDPTALYECSAEGALLAAGSTAFLSYSIEGSINGAPSFELFSFTLELLADGSVAETGGTAALTNGGPIAGDGFSGWGFDDTFLQIFAGFELDDGESIDITVASEVFAYGAAGVSQISYACVGDPPGGGLAGGGAIRPTGGVSLASVPVPSLSGRTCNVGTVEPLNAVPAPASMALLGLGLFGLAAGRRRA